MLNDMRSVWLASWMPQQIIFCQSSWLKIRFFLNDANQLWILFEQKRLIAENDFDVLSDLLKMHRLMIKTK